MDAICSSETSVEFQRTTRRYIPEDRIFPYQSSYTEYKFTGNIKKGPDEDHNFDRNM
jgi:hypothetical protein